MRIQGTIGPLATAMNICALAQGWRVDNGADIPDPWWLLTVNALSLTCTLIANVALLLRMTRRLSFAIANTVTILGWSMSCLLLIILVAVVPTCLRLPPPERQALSQGFYYAIIAAVLSFVVTALMLVTVSVAYKGDHGPEFKLTLKQRTLMLQTISFLVHLLTGAGVYSRIEGWAFLDAMYWADFTLLTVGIGNYAPSTHLGRALLIPYAASGIISLGLLVSSIRATVLERGEQRIARRILECEREKMVKWLNSPNSLGGDAESGRGRSDFILMRKVQKIAKWKRLWTFLLVSCAAWLFLWLVGAVVFWRTERNQHWSYFESVYFAYVSLMTIGYGSLYPQSNSGKPFYVIWSLLAVPALTILVSSLEGTIATVVRDATILIGELTILPGDLGFKERLRSISRISNPRRRSSTTRASTKDMRALRWRSLDSTNAGVDELDYNDPKGPNGSNIFLARNRRAFLLAREIRKVMDDIHESPPKRYTYEEWVWFLKLLDELSPAAADSDRNTAADRQSAHVGASSDGRGGNGPWSWLGDRSVLMADEAEAEWVLKRLCAALEKLLKTSDDQRRGPGPSTGDHLH